jgi:hypothetical protein
MRREIGWQGDIPQAEHRKIENASPVLPERRFLVWGRTLARRKAGLSHLCKGKMKNFAKFLNAAKPLSDSHPHHWANSAVSRSFGPSFFELHPLLIKK